MNDVIIEKIYTKRSIEKIKRKVALLGSFSKLDPINFMNTRLALCFVIFFVTLIFSEFAYITAPLITLAVYFGMEVLLIDLHPNHCQHVLKVVYMIDR